MFLLVLGGLSEAPISEPEVSTTSETGIALSHMRVEFLIGPSTIPARLGCWLWDRSLGDVSHWLLLPLIVWLLGSLATANSR